MSNETICSMLLFDVRTKIGVQRERERERARARESERANERAREGEKERKVCEGGGERGRDRERGRERERDVDAYTVQAVQCTFWMLGWVQDRCAYVRVYIHIRMVYVTSGVQCRSCKRGGESKRRREQLVGGRVRAPRGCFVIGDTHTLGCRK